jgi:hypothetical protein
MWKLRKKDDMENDQNSIPRLPFQGETFRTPNGTLCTAVSLDDLRDMEIPKRETKKPRDWFIFPCFPDRFHLGDMSPKGVCRMIADFMPQKCLTGAGDETPTEKEALANLSLAAAAPRLLMALKELYGSFAHDGSVKVKTKIILKCPDVKEALNQARKVIEEAEA